MHLTPEQQASLEKLASQLAMNLTPIGASFRGYTDWCREYLIQQIQQWLATLPEPGSLLIKLCSDLHIQCLEHDTGYRSKTDLHVLARVEEFFRDK